MRITEHLSSLKLICHLLAHSTSLLIYSCSFITSSGFLALLVVSKLFITLFSGRKTSGAWFGNLKRLQIDLVIEHIISNKLIIGSNITRNLNTIAGAPTAAHPPKYGITGAPTAAHPPKYDITGAPTAPHPPKCGANVCNKCKCSFLNS